MEETETLYMSYAGKEVKVSLPLGFGLTKEVLTVIVEKAVPLLVQEKA